jgi:hypothetical protein
VGVFGSFVFESIYVHKSPHSFVWFWRIEKEERRRGEIYILLAAQAASILAADPHEVI